MFSIFSYLLVLFAKESRKGETKQHHHANKSI